MSLVYQWIKRSKLSPQKTVLNILLEFFMKKPSKSELSSIYFYPRSRHEEDVSSIIHPPPPPPPTMSITFCFVLKPTPWQEEVTPHTKSRVIQFEMRQQEELKKKKNSRGSQFWAAVGLQLSRPRQLTCSSQHMWHIVDMSYTWTSTSSCCPHGCTECPETFIVRLLPSLAVCGGQSQRTRGGNRRWIRDQEAMEALVLLLSKVQEEEQDGDQISPSSSLATPVSM